MVGTGVSVGTGVRVGEAVIVGVEVGVVVGVAVIVGVNVAVGAWAVSSAEYSSAVWVAVASISLCDGPQPGRKRTWRSLSHH